MPLFHLFVALRDARPSVALRDAYRCVALRYAHLCVAARQPRPSCVLRLGLFCLLLATGLPTSAAENTTLVAALSHDPQWLALLQMRRNWGGLAGWHSEVDDAKFFLSHRDDDALAELRETVQQLRSDAATWCRFPARGEYLQQHGLAQRPANLQCKELDYWLSQFHRDKVTLIFPEPYLKNVASIFGHTFLRIDAADTRAHPVLLSKGLSYYADVGAAGGTVSYIAKGLAGGFMGVIEIAPYYQKLRKYSDNEDRDIWEYELALNREQIDLFLRHVWEVRGHSFNYLFLNKNCSYRLIAMLDVVTPTHEVREAFTWHAMPVDTIKTLEDHQLIRARHYVPSATKLFYRELASMTPAQRKQVRDTALHPDQVDRADTRTRVLAAQYSGLQTHQENSAETLAYEKRVHQLALERQQMHTAENSVNNDAPPVTAEDPAQAGHRQSRLQVGWQQDDGRDFAALGIRAAYHDFLDPGQAYQRGVKLEVLDLQMRMHDDNPGLDHATWFALQSYNRRDDFFQPWSWGIALSRERELVGDRAVLLHEAKGYRGLAADCGPLVCHAELTGALLAGGALSQTWAARAGAQAGVLYQREQWSFTTDVAQQKYVSGESDDVFKVQAELGYTFARDLALYGSYTREANDDKAREVFALSLRSYF